ncbi:MULTISPECIES: uracil-DNA glycosylase [unclassified Pseudoclavibacter]|uniref:uracil-DNA glycosylase n=1 Tax=unclassified Pseudoclavibacter TaxID=2615177 RepID=UPI0015C84FFA|nr:MULTISPECIES: uracil-DNA glycosylase [unclassified Pseudoclavibacter]MBS3177623.1 uracil-DNA glycosylase [Pseudoclavibacter sp. Marseille-Q4354]NYF13359.1 uracil-DNA glycosylase [Pseudoclavibacter sp. JAI123]
MTVPAGLADLGRLEQGWARALEPEAGALARIERCLEAEVEAGRGFLPAAEHVLRAFTQPLDQVRVLIVGQDPYPTPGHPIGLSFATDSHVRPLPRSLANIYRELHDDLGIEPAASGDLSRWSEQGVLLLNRVLTVSPGAAGSHRSLGWQAVTDAAITALVARQSPLVAILWGKDAQALGPMLGDTPRIESPHPSPLSASRGFFGSRPFSRANELLRDQGAAPVDWRVETTDSVVSQPSLF